MTIKATEGLAASWYTPRSERKNGKVASQFFIKPLNGPQMLEVQPFYNTDKLTVEGPGLMISVRFGVKGWKNIANENGEDILFHAGRLDHLPVEILSELGAEILRISTLDEDDIKNS